MTIGFFAARSTLRSLHQTVERNLLRQHRRSHARHESSQTSSSARPAPPHAASNAPGDRGAPFTGIYWAWTEPIRIPFRAYSSMQARSPLLTQFESSMAIYFLGDLSAQAMQSRGFADARYEPIRGLRALVIGGVISIPSYKWFLWLGRHFNYPSRLLSLAAKIVFNQVAFAPLINSYFFSMQSLLTGASLRQAWDRVRATVPVSWVNSWKFWPLVTAFSFTFVKPHNRSLVAGIGAIFWQTYLSWLNRNAEKAETKTKEATKALARKGQVAA